MARVRTNIEIEETYLRVVMDRYGLRTKTEAVELALRHLAGQASHADPRCTTPARYDEPVYGCRYAPAGCIEQKRPA
jgi:putative antitoxin of VapBC-like toxin-antitoxin system